MAEATIAQPATGLGSASETNRLLGSNAFDEVTGKANTSPTVVTNANTNEVVKPAISSKVDSLSQTVHQPIIGKPVYNEQGQITTPGETLAVWNSNLNNGQGGYRDVKSGGEYTPPVSTEKTPPKAGSLEETLAQMYEGKSADDLVQADPIAKASMDLINGLKTTHDAEYSGLVAQIQEQYAQKFKDLANKQASSSAGLEQSMSLAGTTRYDPAGSTGLITAKQTADLQQMHSLQADLDNALQGARSAKAANDEKTAQDKLNLYEKIQNKLTEQAKQIVADNKAEKQYNLDVARFNETKDQNAFDNAFKVEQEKFSEQNKSDTLALDRFKAGMGAGGGSGVGGNGITATQMSPTGGVDPISQKKTYDQIVSTYGPMTAVAIQGLVDYSRLPTDWKPGATKGMTRDQAVTLAQMLDPTYTEAGAPARQAYMKSLASQSQGTVGAGVLSANKAINHLTAFVNSTSNLGSTPSSKLNFVLDRTVGQAVPGFNKDFQESKTEGIGVADEMAKFFKGTGATDVKSVDDWKNQLNPSGSPSDIKGLTQGAINLLTGQLEALSEQYKNTMGKAPVNNFLGPSAVANLSNLKNQGYKVDIPGVNFTDKNAYLKHGGSTEALTKAYQALVQANDPNNPPTPENVLEYAQIAP